MSTISQGLQRVLKIEPFIVTACTAAAVASERFLMTAVVVIGMFWFARLATTVSQPRFTSNQRMPPAFGFVVLMGLMLVVTVAVTAFPEVTLPEVWRTIVGIGLFLALFNWLLGWTMGAFHAISIVLMGVLLTLAILTPLMVEWQGNKLGILPVSLYDRLPRLFEDGVNPNVLAGTLVILLPVPLGMLLMVHASGEPSTWTDVVLAVASLLIGVVVFVLTQSRGAYAALALAVIALLLLRWPKLLAPALVLAGLGLISLMIKPEWLTGVGTLVGNSGAIGGLDNRVEIWTRAWYMVQDFAFTGIGMGSFRQVTDKLYPLIITPPGIPHAHNLFLQVAVDLGIPGFVAWVGVLVCALASAWRAYAYGRGWLRALGAGLLASNVALCVHGLTDSVTWGMVRTAPLVWGLWGIAVAAGQVALASRQHRAKAVMLPSTAPGTPDAPDAPEAS